MCEKLTFPVDVIWYLYIVYDNKLSVHTNPHMKSREIESSEYWQIIWLTQTAPVMESWT